MEITDKAFRPSNTSKLHPPHAYKSSEAPYTNLDEVCGEINLTVRELSYDFRPEYKRVSVLAIQWEDVDRYGTDLKVHLAKLMDVFKSDYGFNTETFFIPFIENDYDNDANIPRISRSIEDKLFEWRAANEGPDNLLILYYGGHGLSAPPYKKFTISGGLHDADVDWAEFKSIFNNAQGRKLLILDCCHAASASLFSAPEVEILAASAFDGESCSGMYISFTTHLREVLEDNRSGPISIASIYAKLLPRILVGHENMSYSHWHLLTPAWYLGPRPRHISSGSLGTDSIVLRPRQRKMVVGKKGPRDFDGHVLLSIEFADDSREMVGGPEYSKEVLEKIPGVVVHGAFKAYTVMRYIISLPVLLWNKLPDNGAYTFIGHVSSKNLLAKYRVPEVSDALTQLFNSSAVLSDHFGSVYRMRYHMEELAERLVKEQAEAEAEAEREKRKLGIFAAGRLGLGQASAEAGVAMTPVLQLLNNQPRRTSPRNARSPPAHSSALSSNRVQKSTLRRRSRRKSQSPASGVD